MERYADHFIKYKNSDIHFLVTGTGNEILIAFHGFGQQADMFLELNESLGNGFKIFSIDFAYHGKTIWKEKQYFTRNNMVEIIDLLMNKFEVKKISLLGFSMGGRVALSLVEVIPQKIHRVFLIAPDGIIEKFYYKPIAANTAGTAIFQTMLRHPVILIGWIKLAGELKLVKPYVRDYVVNYMTSEKKREKLFRIWMTMRTFSVNLNRIKQAVEKHQLRIDLVWGKYDKIIPVKNGVHFSEKISCHFELVEGGHFIVKKNLNPVLAQLL